MKPFVFGLRSAPGGCSRVPVPAFLALSVVTFAGGPVSVTAHAAEPPTTGVVGGPLSSGVGCPVPKQGAPGCYYVESTRVDELAKRVGRVVGLRLATVSTGINFRLPSLASAVVNNRGETGQGREEDAIDNDGNGYVDDAYGFDVLGERPRPWDSRLALGTFSASVWVGEARASSPFGAGAVSFRGFVKGASLIPVRAINAQGLTTLEATRRGLRYAASRGARVIHLEAALQSSAGEALCETIREVGAPWRGEPSSGDGELASRGALVVAPAGNMGREVGDRDFPAACDAENLVIVAATDSSGALARFSSYGASRVHVAAPGVNISGLDGNGNPTVRTSTNSASALVAAIAGLLAAARPEEGPALLKKRLVLGADDNPALYGKVIAKGQLNAIKALNAPL